MGRVARQPAAGASGSRIITGSGARMRRMLQQAPSLLGSIKRAKARRRSFALWGRAAGEPPLPYDRCLSRPLRPPYDTAFRLHCQPAHRGGLRPEDQDSRRAAQAPLPRSRPGRRSPPRRMRQNAAVWHHCRTCATADDAEIPRCLNPKVLGWRGARHVAIGRHDHPTLQLL